MVTRMRKFLRDNQDFFQVLFYLAIGTVAFFVLIKACGPPTPTFGD